MPLKQYQRDFINFIIKSNVLSFGEFHLKSGRTSPYFFNAGLFNDGQMLQQLGSFYASALIDSGLEYDVLFGPAYKGIPLVTSLVISLALPPNNKNIPYSFNRKEVKDHGEGGLIVGSKLKGRIVVVDDVITAGTAIREAVGIIKSASAGDASLSGVLIALDRQEKGASGTALSAVQQVQEEFGVKVISIVGLGDVIEWLEEQGGKEYEVHLENVKNYRLTWGV